MTTPSPTPGPAGSPTTQMRLESLWERGLPVDEPRREQRGEGLPEELRSRYGGPLLVPLRDDRPTIIANFVASLDGVVALGTGRNAGGGVISGFSDPDRFVMGLLRAAADVIVMGSGTAGGTSSASWTPAHVHPASGPAFVAWRAAMGLQPQPTVVIVTATGDVTVGRDGWNDPNVPIVVATTGAGAARLGGTDLARHVAIEPIARGDRVGPDDIAGLCASLGARLVLCEGGPHLMGDLVAGDLVDELFLTVAPQLVGHVDGRLGLVEGVGLPAEDARWYELASVKRSGDHLFLRHRRRSDPDAAVPSP
jgi:riboflavin biosynthesis pyrimidine reductase